ncbi:uncharacterized protein LOC9648969 isoform X1 [Selaginella moellendorffii]|uniref:uncharacterized protein LOC9648969 isoform X1 n=2 Tax=Selaginella moellendorffii TaxID=88036 RepID=UPI000D1CBC6A|nr:uncharacterized protein LOC9648969 isoform X1 [Selaginella moellendorffii]|eukprot:XP_024545819.1 uncharacterized protein LOC9648969 isoform X1 [Selaginella moellendorffii]
MMVIEHIDLVADALKLAYRIVRNYQDVPKQRGKCRELIDQVCRLAGLLQELQNSRTPQAPLTPQAKACFEGLNKCLEDAYRVLEKTSRASILRYIFMSKEVDEDLSVVSGSIDGFLKSVPLVCLTVTVRILRTVCLQIQFTQATAIQADVKELASAFSKLSTELQHKSAYTQEQQDLADEVLSILRSRTEDEQESTLDKLLAWLAEKFESDMETVRREWQDMKRSKSDLMTQVGTTSSSKQRIEEKLLEQIIFCIDELEVNGKVLEVDAAGIPGEFLCSVCHDLMKRPVLLTSGHSYCRHCIERCFGNGPAVCPNSRALVQPDLLIDNIALRNAIARWKQTASPAHAEDVDEPVVDVVERSYDEGFVLQTVSELESDNHIKQLRALNCLLEVASSTSGAASILKSGGTAQLVKLLKSSRRMVVEKTAAILALMTSRQATADDTGQVVSEIFEHCLDLVTTGTGTVRLKSAETITNLLSIPEATEFLLSQVGIISSFAALATESEDGMDISLRCLRKLSRNKDASFSGDSSLVACLLDLLKSEEDCIVQESVLALKSAVSSGSSRACAVLKKKNAVSHLVRCAASLSGDSQEAAITVLEHFAKNEGFSDLVEAGYHRFIVQLVSAFHPSDNARLLASILRLSTGCLDLQQDWSFELGDVQRLTSRLMDTLQVKDCTAEALELLKTLCSKDPACKELVVENDGVTVLLVLAVSPRSTCRKGALAVLTTLLRSSACQEEFSRAGGIGVLGNTIQTDDSAECVTEAMISLGLLAGNGKLRHLALKSLDLYKLLCCCIDENFPEQCRESAASLALWSLTERSDVIVSKPSLKQLGYVLQHGRSKTIRTKVAEILLVHASRGGEEGLASLGGSSRLHLVELADEAGETYRELLLSFVSRSRPCTQEEIPLLLEAFSRSEYMDDAVASIRMLVESSTSSHSVLLAAGFGHTGLEALKSGRCGEPCIDDISASLVLLYSCCSQQQCEASPKYVQGLMKLLTMDAPGSVTRAAVCLLSSFAHPDSACLQGPLKTSSHAIKPLLSVLPQARLEALELLSIAVEDSSLKVELYRQGAIPKLIECLSPDNDRVQELAISILLKIGALSEAMEGIRGSMISNGIMDHLLDILRKTGERSQAAVVNSACLIRNLARSLTSGTDNALRTLLAVYRFCLTNSPREGYVERITYVISALETLTVPGTQQLKLLLRDSIPILVKPLQEDYASQGDPDEKIKRSALAILASLLQEASLCKEVRSMLLTRASVLALRNIMDKSGSNECKTRALNLLAKLMTSASSLKEVSKMMREDDCISVVFRLTQLHECSIPATKLIELMKHDRSTRTYIEGNLFPWQRTTSAPAMSRGV